MNISTTDNNSVSKKHIPDTTRYAADLFSRIPADAQKAILDLIKSLLSEQ